MGRIGVENLAVVAAAALGFAGLAVPVWRVWRLQRRDVAWRVFAASEQYTAAIVVLLYATITTLMLAGIVKRGATINYAMEWLLALCILAGSGVVALLRESGRAVPGGASDEAVNPRSMYGPILIAAQAVAFVPFNTASLSEPRHLEAFRALVGRIAIAAKPVISEDMVLVMRAGKRVEIEPAISAELGSVGVWDERPYVRRILRGDFEMFITTTERGGKLFASRYSSEVADAMAKAYPVTERAAGYVIHLPRR